MKNVLSLFFSICSIYVYSQDSIKVKAKRSAQYFGFQLGFTSSNMYGTELDLQLSKSGSYFDPKNGIAASLSFKNEFSRFLYFKTGVDFSQKKGYVRNTTFSYPVSIESSFISIPLILGIQPINQKTDKGKQIALESGICLSENLSSSDNLESGLHPDNTVNRNNNSVSFLIGANLEISITKQVAFQFTYRYQKDLSYFFSRRYKYLDSTNKYVYQDYDVWINSNSFLVGILFKI